MKTIISLCLFLIFSLRVIATQQESDILQFGNLSLSLNTGWGHPSPLETYFYQNEITYPFKRISTANYRGHIATWVIQNNRFYLKEIHVEKKMYLPEKYGIRSKDDSQNASELTFADWFSGLLACKYRDPNDSWKTVSTFIFHIRKGQIISFSEIKNEEVRKTKNTSDSTALDEEASKLLQLYQNYVAYYFRLNESDAIIYENRLCRLNTSFARLGPIFSLFDNSHLNWPYNWENLEKSGAPHCMWRIANDSLILTSLQLYRGTRFDSIEKETIVLSSILPNRTMNEEIFANWVNGIQLIVYGVDTSYDFIFKDFKPKEYIYCRIENGIIKESYTIHSIYNMKKHEESLDPRLKKLIDNY